MNIYLKVRVDFKVKSSYCYIFIGICEGIGYGVGVIGLFGWVEGVVWCSFIFLYVIVGNIGEGYGWVIVVKWFLWCINIGERWYCNFN